MSHQKHKLREMKLAYQRNAAASFRIGEDVMPREQEQPVMERAGR
jgi:hypothetical protein